MTEYKRKFGGPQGYGYQPIPEGHRVTSFRHLLAALLLAMHVGATPSGATDLRPKAPSVRDQGPDGSCTGHATTLACDTALRVAGIDLGFECSPDSAYKLGRAIMRAPGEPLEDTGADPDAVMRGIQEWGVRAMRAPTSDGRNSDCEPATVNDDPTLLDLETDSAIKLVGMYQIDAASDAEFLNQVCFALDAGFPVCFAIDVDEAFENWDGRAPLGAMTGPSLGGHYLCALGYTTNPDGSRTIIFRNSWGRTWGLDGDGIGNEAFVRRWMAAYAMAVKPKTSAPRAPMQEAA